MPEKVSSSWEVCQAHGLAAPAQTAQTSPGFQQKHQKGRKDKGEKQTVKNWLYIALVAVGCITLICCLALYFGHDNAVVTGSVSAIVGIVAGFAAYFKGKSKARNQGQNGNTKADSGS
jgi:uncharacterized membrane-anchored protein